MTLFIDELRGLPAMIGGLSTQQASVGRGWSGAGMRRGQGMEVEVRGREGGRGCVEELFCFEVMMRDIKKM